MLIQVLKPKKEYNVKENALKREKYVSQIKRLVKTSQEPLA
jgi:hypothetical protein